MSRPPNVPPCIKLWKGRHVYHFTGSLNVTNENENEKRKEERTTRSFVGIDLCFPSSNKTEIWVNVENIHSVVLSKDNLLYVSPLVLPGGKRSLEFVRLYFMFLNKSWSLMLRIFDPLETSVILNLVDKIARFRRDKLWRFADNTLEIWSRSQRVVSTYDLDDLSDIYASEETPTKATLRFRKLSEDPHQHVVDDRKVTCRFLSEKKQSDFLTQLCLYILDNKTKSIERTIVRPEQYECEDNVLLASLIQNIRRTRQTTIRQEDVHGHILDAKIGETFMPGFVGNSHLRKLVKSSARIVIGKATLTPWKPSSSPVDVTFVKSKLTEKTTKVKSDKRVQRVMRGEDGVVCRRLLARHYPLSES